MAVHIHHKGDGAKVICKCPRCEKKHSRVLYWTGNGMPRIFCWPCYYVIQSKEEMEGDNV